MGNSLDRLRSTVAHFGVKKQDLTGLENTSRGHLSFVVAPRLFSLVVRPRLSWSSLSWWLSSVVVVVEVVRLWLSWWSVVLLSLEASCHALGHLLLIVELLLLVWMS
jgi:hypothetical protein